MKYKSARDKGKRLEKLVANEFRKIDKYAYRRADSGSGKFKKEDVTTKLPFSIECKHHKIPKIKEWWVDLLYVCPRNRYPVLIYKQDYKTPTVVIMLKDLLSYMSGIKVTSLPTRIRMDFYEFMKLVKQVEDEKEK